MFGLRRWFRRHSPPPDEFGLDPGSRELIEGEVPAEGHGAIGPDAPARRGPPWKGALAIALAIAGLWWLWSQWSRSPAPPPPPLIAPEVSQLIPRAQRVDPALVKPKPSVTREEPLPDTREPKDAPRRVGSPREELPGPGSNPSGPAPQALAFAPVDSAFGELAHVQHIAAIEELRAKIADLRLKRIRAAAEAEQIEQNPRLILQERPAVPTIDLTRGFAPEPPPPAPAPAPPHPPSKPAASPPARTPPEPPQVRVRMITLNPKPEALLESTNGGGWYTVREGDRLPGFTVAGISEYGATVAVEGASFFLPVTGGPAEAASTARAPATWPSPPTPSASRLVDPPSAPMTAPTAPPVRPIPAEPSPLIEAFDNFRTLFQQGSH